MFATLVSGRLVQTQYIQVSPTKILFQLDNATNIHHVAVFLTGAQPLPNGTGAVIYIGYPPFENWQYLGYITNNKPSALFKLNLNQSGNNNQIVTFGSSPVGELLKLV